MSYISLHKNQLLDSLENQVLYADLCSVIIGDRGIGKSYFLERLSNRLDRQVYLSQIEASAELSIEQLEKSIALQLGLSWQSNGGLVKLIKERLDKRALLTVDNAHLLSLSCLEFLMQLVSEQLANKDTHLFVVLTGSAELARKLNQTSAINTNPNVCVVFELEPIQQSETKYLIAEFQEVDVATAESLYGEQKLEYFWQLSKGIPAEIEYQLKRWLDETSLKITAESPKSKMRSYLLAAGYSAIALILVTALVYQDELNEMVAEQPSAVEQNQTDKEKTSTDELTSQPEEPVVTTEESPSDDVTKLPKEVTESTQEDSTEKSTSRKQKAQTQPPTQQPAQQSKEQSLANEQSRDEIGELIESLPSTESNELIDSNAGTESRVDDKDTAESKVKIAKEEPTRPPTQNKTNSSTELTQDERHLLSFLDSQFTLQWVGVSSIESAEKFRQSHPLKEQMFIFRRRQANSWLFLVASGQFNSRDDADHARITYQRRKYPGSPWIKSAKAVKADISSH